MIINDLNIKLNDKCTIYASSVLQDDILKDPLLLNQLTSITSLPSCTNVIGLPDLHPGYVLPIGSVSCFNLNDNPIVMPGGVGFDINCGVRCIKTNLMLEDVLNFEKVLEAIDCSPTILNLKDLNSILDDGLEFLVKSKLISADNLEFTESNGKYPGLRKCLSQKSKGKGLNQFGSLGSGNHYLEVEYVETIFDKEKAEVLGLKENQIVISVHSGSRGLGHQVCKEALQKFSAGGLYLDEGNSESVYLRADDKLAIEYMNAMSSACNYAFGNRAMIAEKAITSLRSLFPRLETELIYDTSHNVAKVETDLDSLVIRKGASRILEPYNVELPFKYKEIGQPVLVGGSMGTASYLICGDDTKKAFRSTCHGSGRIISRKSATLTFNHDTIINDLNSRNIFVKSGSKKGIVEEAPECYKDIDEVVRCSELNGLSRTVCRVRPILVVKDM